MQRHGTWIVVVGAALAVVGANDLQAQLAVPVSVSVRPPGGGMGAPQTIGNINVSIDPTNAGRIFGDFVFDPSWGWLDDWYDFQWVNIVTSYTVGGVAQDTNMNGNPDAPVIGELPGIDPQTTDGPEPYYYNAAEWASGIFGSTIIRTERMRSRFSDRRAGHPAGTVIGFRAYLVVDDITAGGFPDNEFCVIAGFSWTYTQAANGGAGGVTKGAALDAGIGASDIDDALGDANPPFPSPPGAMPPGAGWNATSGCTLNGCKNAQREATWPHYAKAYSINSYKYTNTSPPQPPSQPPPAPQQPAEVTICWEVLAAPVKVPAGGAPTVTTYQVPFNPNDLHMKYHWNNTEEITAHNIKIAAKGGTFEWKWRCVKIEEFGMTVCEDPDSVTTGCLDPDYVCGTICNSPVDPDVYGDLFGDPDGIDADCSSDDDGDGFDHCDDNCPFVPNDQTDTDGDGYGDPCDFGDPCSVDRECAESEVSPTASCTCNRCVNGFCDAGTPIVFGNSDCMGPMLQSDLDDILCELAGFANENSCPNGDIHPCSGNGVIDLDDILWGLDAFGGMDHCGCDMGMTCPPDCPCNPGDCGACCSFAHPHIHPHCFLSTQSICSQGGGTWMGDGTNCNADVDANDVSDVCGFDCNNNGTVDTRDIQTGLSFDCNGNGTPDECESTPLVGNDCNMNGAPDDCEIAGGAPDCNGNGIPDECDFASGLSVDCNFNGMPDECDIANCPPGDRTCADCNGNGIPDQCDIANCPFSDPTCADCDFDGQLDICARCLIPGDMDGDLFVNDTDQFFFDVCISNQGCFFTGCECADMDCDGDYDNMDVALFDAIIQGQMQQVTTAILDFFPKHGPPGTLITVTGVGFGFDPDDLCLVAMDPDDTRVIPFQVIDANDTELIAVAGAQALDDDPAPLMIAKGSGMFGPFLPPPGVDIPLGGWLWQFEGSPPQTCLTDEFTPEPPLNGVIAGEFIPNVPEDKIYEQLVNQPIPDGGEPGLVQNILVPDSGTILDVDIGVDIQHTWFGDLSIAVSHNGTTVVLTNPQTPNDSSNLAGLYVYDDEAPLSLDQAAIAAGPVIPPGNYRPDNPLSAFDGMNKQGLWTLEVIDVLPPDAGFLFRWLVSTTNLQQPTGTGGTLNLTITKGCPAGSKLEVYCRAWDHKSSPVLGVDGYIPCLNFTVNRTDQQCAQDICAAIIALYATQGVTINCTVAPATPVGYTMTMSYPPPNTITWGLFSINVPTVQIEINNTPALNDDYVAWSPTIARARVVGLLGGAPATVVLTNDTATPPAGGDVKFAAHTGGWPGTWPANTTATLSTLTLSLPSSGAWVPFVVAGDFANPSEADKDAIIEVHQGTATGPLCATHPLMVRVRKNGNTLTAGERNRYLTAIAALHGAGNYVPFQSTHSIAGSQAHGTPAFLPWHRAFVLDYERDLQAIDPSVSAHYWKFDAPAANIFNANFMGSNAIMAGLSPVTYAATNPLFGWVPPPAGGLPAFLRRRGAVDHTGDPTTEPFFLLQPDATTLAPIPNDYLNFQAMENNPHGTAHVWIGGDMGSVPTAVRDPIFFMLHSNVDRLWAKWQFMGHHGSTVTEYNAQGAFACIAAPPFRLGAHLMDTMWPWNGLIGPGFCALTTLDDRPPAAPGGPLSPPAAPGFLLGPPAVPTPNDVIDYLGRANPTLGLGSGYDDVPYN